jgi:hypothetical protein
MSQPTGNEFEVLVPDDRRVYLGRYTAGNLKLGPGVYSYSRYPGLPGEHNGFGTCPGSTPVCRSMCYAMRIADNPVLNQVYAMNGEDDVPPLPDGCTLLRWHVSGDFNTARYVDNWTEVVKDNPHVTFWGYTRSWRITSAMLPALKRLRDQPNVQLFASVDPGESRDVIDTLHLDGWRVARIATEGAAMRLDPGDLTCMEESGAAFDCTECRFCYEEQLGDVVFTEH